MCFLTNFLQKHFGRYYFILILWIKKLMQREVNLPIVTLLVVRVCHSSKPGRLDPELLLCDMASQIHKEQHKTTI